MRRVNCRSEQIHVRGAVCGVQICVSAGWRGALLKRLLLHFNSIVLSMIAKGKAKHFWTNNGNGNKMVAKL